MIFVSFVHTRTGANKVVYLLAKFTVDMDAFTWEFIATIVFVGFIGIIYIYIYAHAHTSNLNIV